MAERSGTARALRYTPRPMAKVPLIPLGRARAAFLDDRSFERNLSAMAALEATLGERRAKVAAGWGPEYVGRVHAKNKLTARERIEQLKDADSRVFEVLTFVNFERKFGKLECPGAGVVTAFVRVEQRWTMVIAKDNTVASG